MTHDYYKNPAAIDVLSPEQYYVTQESGTERPFTGEYVDNHEPGIYVDVVSGEPLFASVDKFDSATGWPSFTKPLDGDNIVEKSRWPPLHGAHRSALAPRRQPPRACFHRRTPVRGRCAVLHQFRGAALHPLRQPRDRGVRAIPESL